MTKTTNGYCSKCKYYKRQKMTDSKLEKIIKTAKQMKVNPDSAMNYYGLQRGINEKRAYHRTIKWIYLMNKQGVHVPYEEE